MTNDWQLFWHEHYKRPPLCTSVAWGPYEYEVMNDDGSIERRKSPGAAVIAQRAMKDAYILLVRERMEFEKDDRL